MSLEIERQAGALGAYVSGVALSEPVSDAIFEILHESDYV